VLTCIRALGYLGAACIRVCVSVLVGVSLGLLLGPFAVQAALHYVAGTPAGAELFCCAAQPGTEAYVATLRGAVQQLAALPERLSDLSR
jgi:hypothetical protein